MSLLKDAGAGSAQERPPVPRPGAGIQQSPLSGRLHPPPSQRAEALGWIPACAGMTTGERPEATEPAPLRKQGQGITTA